MPKKNQHTILLALVIAVAATAFAADATPPRSAGSDATRYTDYATQRPAKTINAVIVKSWGDNPVWADLNTNWSTYGKIPVNIDHTTYIKSDFTYQDLVNSKANVVIISDAAGGTEQYSTAEIAAVVKYAKKGHSVLGTYATLEYSTYDNRGLAPVFGLSSALTYTTTGISGDFKKDASHACLLTKIKGSSWQSMGFNTSQVPESGSWTGNLGKATAEADSDSFIGVISLYKTAKYAGVYVSNMPEYQNVGGPDEQFLYNAITCYAK
jgi:hypothetical protein